MSGQIQNIMIVIVGGLMVLAIAVMVIIQISGLGYFNAQTSSNLVSSSEGISELIPIFAAILGVGVLGLIVQKR